MRPAPAPGSEPSSGGRRRRAGVRVLIGVFVLTLAGLAAGNLSGRGAPSPTIIDPGGSTDLCAATGQGQNPAASIDGATISFTAVVGSGPPVSRSYDKNQFTAALSDPTQRVLDADSDGHDDLQWNAVLNGDVASTNAASVLTKIGAVLDSGGNKPLSVGFSFDRLADDQFVAPAKVTLDISLDSVDSQTMLPKTLAFSGGYDARPTNTNPPTSFALDVAVQVKPAALPTSLVASVRQATVFRVNGDPSAPEVPVASRPGLKVIATGGNKTDATSTMDASMTWDRTPAQYAVGFRVPCVDPNGVAAAMDVTENAAGSPPVPAGTVTPPTLGLDLTMLKTAGIGGHPAFDGHASFAHLPDELSLTGQNGMPTGSIVVKHNRHGNQPTSPLPDITLTTFRLAFPDSDPTTTDRPLNVSGKLTGLPPATSVDLTKTATGVISSADARFCDGTWGTPGCDATLTPVGNVRVVIDDLFPTDPTTLPSFANKPGPYVGFALRDTGTQGTGPLSSSSEKDYRVGFDVSGVKHVHADVPTCSCTGVNAHLDGTQLPSIAAQIDVDTSKSILINSQPKPSSKLVGSSFTFNGTITPLPATVDVAFTSTDAVPLDLTYDTSPTKVRINGSVAYSGGTDSNRLQMIGTVALGDASPNAGLPSKAHLLYGQVQSNVIVLPGQPTPPASYHVVYDANADTHIVAGVVATTATDRTPSVNRWNRAWVDATVLKPLEVVWDRSATDPTAPIGRVEVGQYCPGVCVIPSGPVASVHARVLRVPPAVPLPNPFDQTTKPDLPNPSKSR